MPARNHRVTQKELAEIKRLLRVARDHYDDKLAQVNQAWADLEPQDYAKRRLLMSVVKDFISLDRELKSWELKLNEPG